MPQKLIEYGTRFGMRRGATMNLAPNELKNDVLRSNLHTNSEHALETYQT